MPQAEPVEEDDDVAEDAYEPDPDLGPGGEGVVLRYTGLDWLPPGVPTREALVAAAPGAAALAAQLRADIGAKRPLHFMPNDLVDRDDYDGGYPQYTIRLFGVLKDGSKAEVLLTGIDPFFDVAVPTAASKPGHFDAYLRAGLATAGVKADACRFSVVWAPYAHELDEGPVEWRRLTFRSLAQRKLALAHCQEELRLRTASDDPGSYYRKVGREMGLPYTDWAILGSYEYAPDAAKSPLCPHVFRVRAADYKPLIDPMAPKATRQAAAAVKDADPLLTRDRTLVVAWDIETISDDPTGEAPEPTRDADHVFMICMTAHWKDSAEALARVCLVDLPTAPDPRWTTVVCGSQVNLLRAFALCWRALAPDAEAQFNGGQYDWNFIVEKARRLEPGLLGWMFTQMTATPRRTPTSTEDALKWQWVTGAPVKISAEAVHTISYLRVPGCVMLDVRPIFRKLYPKAEKNSLKFYLEVNGLAGKAELPIALMWRYYREAAAATAQVGGDPAAQARGAELMRHVAHYCVVDSLACQRLLVRRNIINDYREVSSLSFVSLADSNLKAGGMKVCNMLAAYAGRRGYLSTAKRPERTMAGKYPGAYVFPPEKGLVPDPGRQRDFEEAAAGFRRAAAALYGSAAAEPVRELVGELLAAVAPQPLPAPPELEKARGAGPSPAELETARALSRAAVATAARPGLDPALLRDYEREVVRVVLAVLAYARDRPVTGLDFSSLYPSIIMTYNLSPEKITRDPAKAEKLRAAGKTLHLIEFPYGGEIIRGWSVMHENRPEDIGLYPSILIDLFNKRAEVKVVLNAAAELRELIELVRDTAHEKGVSVAASARAVLAEAEAEAAAMAAATAPGVPPPRPSPGSTVEEEVAEQKRRLKVASNQVKALRALIAGRVEELGEDGQPVPKTDEEIEAEINSVYDEQTFIWTKANSKQNALKVFMNTFYGEAGNELSPWFLLVFAGGVTSGGVYNIQLVARFCLQNRFIIKYGDTDSLYLICPAMYFVAVDADFICGVLDREEHWTAMVKVTMRVLNAYRNDVNGMLARDNGTRYLNMAYEEVLYPVVFTGKKKYFGVPHMIVPNFYPKKLFIKGIDIVKQGVSKIAVTIGMRIMKEATKPSNRRNLYDIVFDVIRDAASDFSQWGFDDFVLTAAWKPEKNNVTVHRFIRRMKARHELERAEADRLVAAGRPRPRYKYELPLPGERFSYVLVQVGSAYDLRGRKVDLKKGDRMEFARVAKADRLPIDIGLYITNYVAGLCARFVNSEERFLPKPEMRALMDDKRIDELAQDAAKKAIIAYIDSLGDVDAEMRRQRGLAYRRAFAAAAKESRGALYAGLGANADLIHGPFCSWELFDEAGVAEPPPAAAAGAAGAPVQAPVMLSVVPGAPFDREGGVVQNVWAAAGREAAAIAHRCYGEAWCTRVAARLGISRGGADSPAPAEDDGRAPSRRLFRLAAVLGPARPTPAVLARRRALEAAEAAARRDLRALLPAIRDFADLYEADLTRLVDGARAAEHAAQPTTLGGAYAGPPGHAPPGDEGGRAGEPELACLGAASPEVIAALKSARLVYYRMVGVQAAHCTRKILLDHLVALKNRRTRAVSAPPAAERAALVAEAVGQLKPPAGVVLL